MTPDEDVVYELRSGARKVEALKNITGLRGASLTTLRRLQASANKAADRIDSLLIRVERAEAALRPFAATAEQLDRELPWARNGRVTFINPANGDDRQFETWPIPDDHLVLNAWRYHDPQAVSEHIGFKMSALRAARAALPATEAK